MKKLVLSVLTLAVTTVVAVGATRALFSDTETQTGDVLGAATLDLTVDGKDSIVPFTISDLVPGQRTGSPTYQICNAGTVPGVVTLKVNNFTTDEHSVVEPEASAGDSDVTKLDPDGYTVATTGTGELLDQVIMRFWVDDTSGQRPAAFDWQDKYWEGYPDESATYHVPQNTDLIAGKNFVLNAGSCGYMGAVVTFIDDQNAPYGWILDGVPNNAAMNDSISFDMEVGLVQQTP